jgi:hypothetical protein
MLEILVEGNIRKVARKKQVKFWRCCLSAYAFEKFPGFEIIHKKAHICRINNWVKLYFE